MIKPWQQGLSWKAMWMGGRAQGFFSLVVAISSTEATRALSVCPVKRLIFQTRQCFLLSYLALPAGPPHQGSHDRKRALQGNSSREHCPSKVGKEVMCSPPHDGSSGL